MLGGALAGEVSSALGVDDGGSSVDLVGFEVAESRVAGELEVDLVVDPEVLAGHEQALVDGVPHAQLGGEAPVEPFGDALAVCSGVAVRPSSTLGRR